MVVLIINMNVLKTTSIVIIVYVQQVIWKQIYYIFQIINAYLYVEMIIYLIRNNEMIQILYSMMDAIYAYFYISYYLDKQKNIFYSVFGDEIVTHDEQCDNGNLLSDLLCLNCKLQCQEEYKTCIDGNCFQCNSLGWQLDVLYYYCYYLNNFVYLLCQFIKCYFENSNYFYNNLFVVIDQFQEMNNVMMDVIIAYCNSKSKKSVLYTKMVNAKSVILKDGNLIQINALRYAEIKQF
ncbi:unnamed protein product [Paramecium primaurelia]|uniref:Transmembrane protein n=1 Tax=Paramecium primaurelia TaxID=5886 RepID=A0A8S1K5F2_PARPR|nr:unnamed protein product [Paramecium primaurelia]